MKFIIFSTKCRNSVLMPSPYAQFLTDYHPVWDEDNIFRIWMFEGKTLSELELLINKTEHPIIIHKCATDVLHELPNKYSDWKCIEIYDKYRE